MRTFPQDLRHACLAVELLAPVRRGNGAAKWRNACVVVVSAGLLPGLPAMVADKRPTEGVGGGGGECAAVLIEVRVEACARSEFPLVFHAGNAIMGPV